MKKFLCAPLFFLCFLSWAGVLPERTRIVYDEKNATQSYVMVNTNHYPVIVQFWIDDGNPNKNPSMTASPFVVTPVMARMDPLKINSIKVIYSEEGEKLAKDRESLLWFNIFEVPPKNLGNRQENEIALTMLTQIKLIFRPDSLKLGLYQLINKLSSLQFIIQKTAKGDMQLTVENPTPYIASFSALTVVGTVKDKTLGFKPIDTDMTVLPKSKKIFHIETGDTPVAVQEIEYSLIDDLGETIQLKRKLSLSS